MPKHCNLCGNPIAPNTARIYTRKHRSPQKGLTICAQCEHDQPRCLVCQTPMARERAAVGICRECLREGLKCRSCGKHIVGEFLLVNGNDGPYCAACYRRYARCEICGAPAGDDAVTLGDGRIVCARCHSSAITDPREGNELFEQVIDQLGSTLDLRLNIRPHLALVDRARLIELSRAAAQENGHAAEHVMGLFVRHGRRRFIYVQEHLPRILFIQIVAHEFAHAWQGEQAPLVEDALRREGFAEWVAYHMLDALGAQKKAAQMLQRADVYGDGLRYWLAIETQHGIASVLKQIRVTARERG